MNATRRIAMIVAIPLALALLAGCSSSPSASNFQAAIQRHFDHHDPVCMFPSNYPGHDVPGDLFGINALSHALARAGLFTTSVYKHVPAVPANIAFAAVPAQTLYSYKLTALGRKYYSTQTKCIGFDRRVVAVTNYTKEDKRHYGVDFTYQYVVPTWANDPFVIDAAKQDPALGNYAAYRKAHGKPLKDQAYLTLTHNGWRVAQLSLF